MVCGLGSPGPGRARPHQPRDLQNGGAEPVFRDDFEFPDSDNGMKPGPKDSRQPRVTCQGTTVPQEAPRGEERKGALDKPPAAAPRVARR